MPVKFVVAPACITECRALGSGVYHSSREEVQRTHLGPRLSGITSAVRSADRTNDV